MEELLITGARFLGALPMFVAACCLVLMNRGKLQSAVYNRSRWFITAATLILGVQFAIQFVGQLREQSVTLCWTLNMMAYVIATPLYNMAELNLLRAGHNMRDRYKWNGIFMALCYVILAIGYFTDTLINDQQPWLTATFVVAFLYFLKVIELSWVLFQEMKKTNTRLTDEELTERHKVLRYTARVMKWIILVSLFSPWVGMSSSLMLNALYGIVIFILLLIFFVTFIVYGYNMAECIEVNDEIAEAVMIETEVCEGCSTPNPGVDDGHDMSELKQRIEEWVSRRRFTDPSLTISEALGEMCISPSALNFYLENNTTVGGYRKWLPYLRIEEARRIMLEHPDYTLQAIAEECGYANSSNFSRTFKQLEGMTPGQWLSDRKQKEQ
ncbi:MAG: AraC family transcriptional regulator [Bacteroidales bacterium]|nr:AraC family transcriptional regulator [Bacteroidales bacterium]